MSYGIEKDENGDEALYMNAVIRNDIVELDWVRKEDDLDAYAERGMRKVKTIVDANTSSFPPRSAFLTMRLYRRGDVRVGGIGCAYEYREQAIRLAKEAALALYDEVYPDSALAVRAFVEESIKNVEQFAADEMLHRLGGEQLAADQLLPRLLDLAKADLAKTGVVVQRIGWHVHSAMALFPIDIQPFEKYRYFRAVAEVARRVNADAVVYVSDSYVLTPDGQRTGDELLQITWVNPDASCITSAVVYARRKHPLAPQEIIDFLSDTITPNSKAEQNIIPPWGIYQPN